MVELALAVTVGMLVAGGVLMMLNTHTSFMQAMSSFRFLRDEAPQVNSLVTQLVSKSSSYRIHSTPADAFSGASAVNVGGEAVRLIYQNPSGLIDQSVIAFETVNGTPQLSYYRFQNGAWPAQADWTITSQVASASFSDDGGVLLMSLTGPENEQITYAGTTQ